MLNSEQIAQFIQQPELIRVEDISVLSELADKHPYSSVFSLLYLQSVAKFQSINLDAVLPKHAYKLSDRTRLYYAIQERSELVTSEIPVEAYPEKQIDAPITLPIETTQLEAPIEKVATQDEPKVDSDDVQQDQQFEIEILASTLEQSFTLEEKESVEENSVSVSKETIAKLAEEVEKSFPENLEGSKRTFTNWLKASHAEKTETPVQPKTDKQALIDKFIATSPSMPKPTAEFYSPTKKAKESIDENRIPVSETLAKIYAAQGNYPKAIHVYHQLILAFPEKKSLFAIQIEELKKKNNA